MTADVVHAPLEEQVAVFTALVQRNPTVGAILERLPDLGVPDAWLAAGCLFQTVWNVLSDRDPRAGILDYDVTYCDDVDLGWDAEDVVIRRAERVFAGVDGRVEVRNEARVHLWYEEKFGVRCPPYTSTAHAISTFPNCSSCVAVRPGPRGLEVLAPYGLTDLFAMVARPNPLLAPGAVYRAKTDRWRAEWPALTVLPWPT